MPSGTQQLPTCSRLAEAYGRRGDTDTHRPLCRCSLGSCLLWDRFFFFHFPHVTFINVTAYPDAPCQGVSSMRAAGQVAPPRLRGTLMPPRGAGPAAQPPCTPPAPPLRPRPACSARLLQPVLPGADLPYECADGSGTDPDATHVAVLPPGTGCFASILPVTAGRGGPYSRAAGPSQRRRSTSGTPGGHGGRDTAAMLTPLSGC